MYACHSCDTPSCVNEDHLFEGTPQDNCDDMVSKRRSAWGERHSQARLTNHQVTEIFDRLKRGDSRVAIARDYGVNSRAIDKIANGKRWLYLREQLGIPLDQKFGGR
jgi:hypothetical protein